MEKPLAIVLRDGIIEALEDGETMSFEWLSEYVFGFALDYYQDIDLDKFNYKFKKALNILVESGIVEKLQTPKGDHYRLNPNPPKVKKRQCKTCGKTFKVKNPPQLFCSRECHNIFYLLTDPPPYMDKERLKNTQERLRQRLMTNPNLQHLATELFLNADD